MTAYRLDVAELHAQLDAQRQARRLWWSDVCHAAGVPPAVLHRIADGYPPDAHALVSLLLWLGPDTELASLIKTSGETP